MLLARQWLPTSRNVQVLKGDELVAVHQFAYSACGEIRGDGSNAFVNILDNPLMLAIFRRAFSGLTQSALRFSQCLFIVAEKAGILDFLTRRQRGEGFQTHVYADHGGHRRQGFRRELTRETGVPVAQRIAPDGKRFGGSNNGAVQLDFYMAYLRQAHAAIIKKTPVAFLLRVGERI